MPFCKCKHGLWSRGVSRGATSPSTCKTFSSSVIDNLFRPTIYLKQNIIIFVKKLPDREFIFLLLAS
jgi:hypothetical protein